MCFLSLIINGISKTPNSSWIDAITDDGNHMFTVPNFSFCIPCLSLPSCEEPNTLTLPLLPNLSFASLAKWSTDAENNEPGLPTCPNFTSVELAEKLKNNDEIKTTITLLNLFIFTPSVYLYKNL